MCLCDRGGFSTRRGPTCRLALAATWDLKLVTRKGDDYLQTKLLGAFPLVASGILWAVYSSECASAPECVQQSVCVCW